MAQWRIWRAGAIASPITLAVGLSGEEVALAVMQAGGVRHVEIEQAEGELSNHYDEGHQVLRLSPEVYAGQSLAAAGIAAHEAGHAIQGAAGYPLRIVRKLVVPLASIGSTVCWLLVAAGLLIGMKRLVYLGIGLFTLDVVLQVVNLPVEFDASRRGREALRSTGLVKAREEDVLMQVMNAAAWTYVGCAVLLGCRCCYIISSCTGFRGENVEGAGLPWLHVRKARAGDALCLARRSRLYASTRASSNTRSGRRAPLG